MMQRSHLMDGLRILAAHLIVVHHLASYGPLAESFAQSWPVLHHFLYVQGRMATQVFLVMAGFLTAQTLLERPAPSLFSLWGKRYWRLAPTYLVAIAGVTVVVGLLRPIIQGDWLTEEPTILQGLAHVFLLQDLLGLPSMSIGVWYVAIDFQLFLTLSFLYWAMKDGPEQVPPSDQCVWRWACLVAVLCLTSQWFFNRDAIWDRWAFYFFESYGLGVLVAVAKRLPRVYAWVALCIVSAIVSYAFMPRPRLLLSVLMALTLIYFSDSWRPQARLSAVLQRQSETSYALFLSHFMVLVVANAAWMMLGRQHEGLITACLLLTWVVCGWFAGIVHDLVETLMRRCWRPRA